MAREQRGSTSRALGDVLTDLDELLDELTGRLAPDTPGDRPTVRESMTTPSLVSASARLRAAGARMDAVRWSILPRIETAGLWAQTGARTFAVWLARTEDVQTATARRDVRTARALRDHLPATLSAALTGRVGVDKIRALVDVATTSTNRTDALAAPAVDVATVDVPIVDVATVEVGTVEPVADPACDPDASAPADTTDDPVSGAPTTPGSPTWEEQLLDWSTRNGPDRFRGLVRYFARHADPDADERGYTKARQREYLDVAPTLGGYHLSGFLTEEHGQALTTAIGSVMGTPAAADDRTPGQRRAQALADLSRIVLDDGRTGTGASVRPHLSVTVSWTELQALAARSAARDASTRPGAGVPSTAAPNAPVPTVPVGPITPSGVPRIKRPAVFTETSAPVPASLLRRIACDSEVTRIVFGADSQILDVGRSRRTVTGQLRRAVIARDQHCVYGQCDQPPTRCEVHHALRHWAHGGETSTTNAALLCYHHHDLVDTQNIAMHYDEGWHFTHPNGHVTHPTRTHLT
ncbi:HNH endonuclease signature motif containing protein [Promicromonospora sp. MEB111]|uniref:HNH endonuclease signature motif containing protein n=1 Tax=Promicromonospora sp. MEB111 TaxID=3040301 RepID=UPI00254D6BD5|nr:HNH endonuclease signature motif containing protein [Promicromonospora sp. MEB111]